MDRHIDDLAHAETLLAGRRRALASLDLSWGRRLFPGAPDGDVEVAMHKARYHASDIEPALRIESAKWLHARRLPDILGRPIAAELLAP